MGHGPKLLDISRQTTTHQYVKQMLKWLEVFSDIECVFLQVTAHDIDFQFWVLDNLDVYVGINHEKLRGVFTLDTFSNYTTLFNNSSSMFISYHKNKEWTTVIYV